MNFILCVFFNHGANYVIFVWILNSKWKTEENKKKNIEKETNTIKMNLKEIKSEFWMCFLVPKVKSKSFSVVGHHHKMLCVAEINVVGHFIFSSTFASSSNVFFIGFYFIILFFFLNGTSTDHVDTRKRFFLLQLMCIVYSFEWQRLFFFFSFSIYVSIRIIRLKLEVHSCSNFTFEHYVNPLWFVSFEEKKRKRDFRWNE